jgi:NAD(P)-dependent dehydrogenase (short-subunit alcohol dehydrogenase family)
MSAALHDRRCIVYGAEAGHGPALVRALRDAGAQVAITSATTDGAALFALKRLAGPGGAAQAVDLTNPTNVRVATRKLAKQLGGLDMAVVAVAAGGSALLAVAARELRRADRPLLIVVGATAAEDPAAGGGGVPLHALSGPDPAAQLLALLEDGGER